MTDYATGGPLNFTKAGVPDPLGVHNISMWQELDKDITCFSVETLSLNTGNKQVWPTVMITNDYLDGYGDETELIHYVAATLANYMNRPDLVPSLEKILLKFNTKYFPVTKNFANVTYVPAGISFAKHIAKSSSASDPERLSYSLPGIRQLVKHPVKGNMLQLRSVIMDLNDTYKWSREKIADWLDEISDPTGVNGPDLRFKVKDDTPDEQLEIEDPGAKYSLAENSITINTKLDEKTAKEWMELLMGNLPTLSKEAAKELFEKFKEEKQ